MEKITIKKEIEVTKFIANDGEEFGNQWACKAHEWDIHDKENMPESAEAFKLKVLNGYPPCDGSENWESHNYEWFKVNNVEELTLVRETFQITETKTTKCDSFPEYICIEHDDTYYQCFGQTLSRCIEYVKELLGKLGFDVIIIPKKEA